MNISHKIPHPSPESLFSDRPGLAAKPPFLGFGLGLRAQHYDEILNGNPPIDWFEIISENYMLSGGKPLRILDRIRERFPVVMHGVSLSIASTAPPDFSYLQALKDLAGRVEPKWISDHLCWTGVHGTSLHDLLPIPYTREALDHVVSRVQLVQDYLGRPIVLENVSTYVQFGNSEMTEWEFISELTRRSGCWLLFDVNNVYVSAFNHGYDPYTFLEGIPADRVVQFHMAGHSHMGTHIIDTHDHPVCEDVWDLYAAALRRFGHVSTMIERDDNIPSLDELIVEVNRTREIAAKILPSLGGQAGLAISHDSKTTFNALSWPATIPYWSTFSTVRLKSATFCSASTGLHMSPGWSKRCARTTNTCTNISAMRCSMRWARIM